MMIKRSSDFWLVAYFLSRCCIRQEGQDSLPPKQLKIDLWKEAYDQFFESIADGRTPGAFRRSLKLARDSFDSHISSGPRGWRDPDTDEPMQLPNLARKVLERWEPARDQELWSKVTAIIDLALKPNDRKEAHKGLGEESPKITFETIAKKQNQPFLRKLINFCRSQSTKPTLEEFLKKKQFSFPKRECFRSMNIRFNDKGNYVRLWAQLKSGFSIDDGIRILKEKFRSELDFTIQEHEKHTDALHPFIETSQQCEDLIDWLSSSPDPEKEKRRLDDRNLRNFPNSLIDEEENGKTVNPGKKVGNRAQGFGLNYKERKAVETRAMIVTKEYLLSKGYKVQDTSANKPYDFLATSGSDEIKVEVKGTTSDIFDSFLMTANEVALHNEEKGMTALSLVSSIKFKERGDNPSCEEGNLEFYEKWDIGDCSLKPITFSVKRNS